MVDYQIIDFQPEYFDKLNSFWEDSGLGGNHRGDSLELVMSTLHNSARLILMIDMTNDIIGTSWLTNDSRRTYIHHFGIRKDYRNSGLGGVLLNHCLNIAKLIGLQVKLEVHKDNLPAQKLYRKYGFQDLGDYQVLIMRNISD